MIDITKKKISEDEYKELRSGEKTGEQLTAESETRTLSTRDFLLARTKETKDVPIIAAGETRNLEIKVRLSRAEMKRHDGFFALASKMSSGNISVLYEDESALIIARFLEDITVDPQLNEEFWMDPNLDTAITQQLLASYFEEPIERLPDVESFRNE